MTRSGCLFRKDLAALEDSSGPDAVNARTRRTSALMTATPRKGVDLIGVLMTGRWNWRRRALPSSLRSITKPSVPQFSPRRRSAPVALHGQGAVIPVELARYHAARDDSLNPGSGHTPYKCGLVDPESEPPVPRHRQAPHALAAASRKAAAQFSWTRTGPISAWRKADATSPGANRPALPRLAGQASAQLCAALSPVNACGHQSRPAPVSPGRPGAGTRTAAPSCQCLVAPPPGQRHP